MENFVKKLREQKGWSQEQLGDNSGATKGQISKIETGAQKLTENWMIRLSKALDVEPWELIKRGQQPFDERFEQIETAWSGFSETYKEELTNFTRDLKNIQDRKNKLK